MSHVAKGMPVELLLYDVSKGASRMFSFILLGRHFEAIYHSSVLVFGAEYWYGNRVFLSEPPLTKYFGPPLATSVVQLERSSYKPDLQVVPLGTTFKSPDDFHKFLGVVLAARFRSDNYDVLTRNCNCFTDEAVQFLTGHGIPDAVRQLPELVMNTPTARLLRPFLNRWLGGVGGGGDALQPTKGTDCFSPPTVDHPTPDKEVAELVLECVFADGADVDRMSAGLRAIALRFGPSSGQLEVTVGRQHQPEFFERLVKKRELLASISRSHFQLYCEPGSTEVKLRKLSKNALLVNYVPIDSVTSMPVPEGTHLAFHDSTNDDMCFLVLRVDIRSRDLVSAKGAHPAMVTSYSKSSTMQLHGSQVCGTIAAVLECVSAMGTNLSAEPVDSKVIPLSLDKPLRLGRHHQLGLFERLLKSEPRWLGFVSRTHCQVVLRSDLSHETATNDNLHSQASTRVDLLYVENLSRNQLLVEGAPVVMGGSGVLCHGAKLSFVAQDSDVGCQCNFLEFVLRRVSNARTNIEGL